MSPHPTVVPLPPLLQNVKDHVLEELDENEQSTHAKVAYLIIDLAACNGELLLLLLQLRQGVAGLLWRILDAAAVLLCCEPGHCYAIGGVNSCGVLVWVLACACQEANGLTPAFPPCWLLQTWMPPPSTSLLTSSRR